MTLDAQALGRGIRHVDQSLRHARAAMGADVPLLLGRRDATDAVRAQLGEAAEWASHAAIELRRGGSGLEDATSAIDELARTARAARDGDVLRARNDDAMRGAVDDAQSWINAFGRAETGVARALQGGSAEWLSTMLGPPTGADRLRGADRFRAVRVLALTDTALDVDDYTRSLLRRLDPSDQQSIIQAREAVRDGGPAVANAVLRSGVDSALGGGTVDAAIMREALAAISPRPDAIATEVPMAISAGRGSIELDIDGAAQLALALEQPTLLEAGNELDRMLQLAPSQLRPLDLARGAVLATALKRAGAPGELDAVAENLRRSADQPESSQAAWMARTREDLHRLALAQRLDDKRPVLPNFEYTYAPPEGRAAYAAQIRAGRLLGDRDVKVLLRDAGLRVASGVGMGRLIDGAMEPLRDAAKAGRNPRLPDLRNAGEVAGAYTPDDARLMEVHRRLIMDLEHLIERATRGTGTDYVNSIDFARLGSVIEQAGLLARIDMTPLPSPSAIDDAAAGARAISESAPSSIGW